MLRSFIASIFAVIIGSAASGICGDVRIQSTMLYPYQSSIEVQDEFTSGTAVTGFIGNLGWGFGNGTISIITSETNRPGIYRRDTSAVISTLSTLQLFPHSSSLFAGNLPHRLIFAVRLNTNDANTTTRFGVGNSIVGNPPGEGIYFEKLDGDTNWFCITRASSVETRTDSGTAITTNFATFEYRRLSASVEFYINGALVCTNAANLTTALIDPFHQIINSAAASKTMDFDYFQLQLSGLTR